MRMIDIISKKRDNLKLTTDEIFYFVNGYCRNEIPDYQIAALLMAIFLNGLEYPEISSLTNAMVQSGQTINLSDIKGNKIDKHSTGGVGDKLTLIIAPIVAACDVIVTKMSGPGLGFTGGTIDKLHSIPGFITSLTIDQHKKNLKTIGLSISGQNENLVLADKKLYALRDVTATVNSLPMIASSIMSKKIASGADKIVLDVKVGQGGLVGGYDEAVKLSKIMIRLGKEYGIDTIAVLTDMNNPLGYNIGNSLEVIESIEVLKGSNISDLKEVALHIAATMLQLSKKISFNDSMDLAKNALSSKAALRKFRELIQNQNGISEVINNYNLFKKPLYKHKIVSQSSGFIKKINTDKLGRLSVILGAGREKKGDNIDYSAGIKLCKKTSDSVQIGDILLFAYTDKPLSFEEINMEVQAIYEFTDFKPHNCQNIIETIY